MTISKRVQQELEQATPGVVVLERKRSHSSSHRSSSSSSSSTAGSDHTTRRAKAQREAIAARTKGQAWTAEEHERFLEGLKLFPSGPWEAVAEHVGTKNSRQTMTHAQKYRQKHERQQRGLRSTAPKKQRLDTPRSTPAPTAASAPVPVPVVAVADAPRRESPEPLPVTTAMTKPSQILRDSLSHALRPSTSMFVGKFLDHDMEMLDAESEATLRSMDQLTMALSITGVESPRSGEEEWHSGCSTDSLASGEHADVEKKEVVSLFEPFAEFDDPWPTMWSTNSLMNLAADILDEDPQMQLPVEFSTQSMELWAP